MIETKQNTERGVNGVTDKCKENKNKVTRWTRFCVFRWCSDVRRRVFNFDLKKNLLSIAYSFRMLEETKNTWFAQTEENQLCHTNTEEKNETNFLFDVFLNSSKHNRLKNVRNDVTKNCNWITTDFCSPNPSWLL